MPQIELKVYRKGIIRKFVFECSLIFSNEKQVEDFLLSLNADVDFIDIGSEHLRRSLITKVERVE